MDERNVVVKPSLLFKDCWNVLVNGNVVIKDESFAVCDQVRDSLVAGQYDTSEIGEVAERIAAAVKGN